mmetsp:Transcript_14786/g.44426  ORF Transcript_14786/g.44426 Transcript_14786/m.44426 type:complete len:216 (+) Transcript_14786:3434-4081(+)
MLVGVRRLLVYGLPVLALLLRLLGAEGHDVTREQVLDGPLLPPELPVHVHVVGLRAHAPQRRHGLQPLEGGRSLEAEDRHEREAGVLPVGVQHPQGSGCELEDGKRRHELLLEEVHECGPRELEDVGAVLVLRQLDLGVGLEALGAHVLRPPQVRRAMDQADAPRPLLTAYEVRVLHVCRYALVGLVLEGEVELQGHLRLLYLADVGRALVGVRS